MFVALSGVQCVQDLVTNPSDVRYELRLDSATVALPVGEQLTFAAIRSRVGAHLTADGVDASGFDFVLSCDFGNCASGSAVEVDTAARTVTVARRGVDTVRVRLSSIALAAPVDAVVRVTAYVPKLVFTSPSYSLSAINATVTPVVRALDTNNDTIPGTIAVRLGFASGASAGVVDTAGGVLRAIDNGQTTVQATIDGAYQDEPTATAPVTVQQRAARIENIPSPVLRQIGQTRTLSGVVVDAGGTPLRQGSTITWRSLADTVATVGAGTGVVTAVRQGAAQIEVTGVGVVNDAVLDTTTVTVDRGRLVVVPEDTTSGTVGGQARDPFSVQLVSSTGSTLTDSGITVRFTVTTPGASFGAATDTMVRTDATGRAVSPRLTLPTQAGSYQVTVAQTGLLPVAALSFSARALPAQPATVSVDSGDGQSADLGTTLPIPLRVRVRDVHLNGVGGVTVTWTATVTGSLADTVSAATSLTDSTGRASVGLVLGTRLDTAHAVVASLAGVPGVAPDTFTIHALLPASAVLAKDSGDLQAGTVATALAARLVARVTLADGRAVRGVPVQWAGGAPSVTDSTGRSAHVWTLGTLAGVQNRTASVAGLTVGTVQYSATALAGPPATIRPDSGFAQTQVVGRALTDSLVAFVGDAYGNAVNGQAVRFTVSSGFGVLSNGTATFDTQTDSLGRARAMLVVDTVAGAGRNVVQAQAPGLSLSGSPAVFTATGTPDVADHVRWVVAPDTSRAGTQLLGSGGQVLRVQIEDRYNNVVNVAQAIQLGMDTTVTSDTVLTAPPIVTTNGAATITGASISQAGTGFRLVARSGALRPDTSAAFPVVPAAVSRIVFTQQPTTARARTVIAPAIRAELRDASDNLVTNDVRWVVLTLPTVGIGGSDIFYGTKRRQTVGGTVVFDNISLDAAATGYQLQVEVENTTIAVQSLPFAITSGVAATIAYVSGNGQNGVVGTTLTEPFTVVVTDANGAPVPGDTVIFDLTAGGGTLAGLSADTVLTNGAGQASTVLTLGTGAGTNEVSARSTALSGQSVPFSASATPSGLQLVFLDDPTNASGGAPIGAFHVAVQDFLGVTEPTATTNVTLTIMSGTGNPVAAIANATAAAQAGVVTFASTSIDRAGTGYRLIASATGLKPDTSATFTIGVGAPARVAFVTNPASATAGAGIGTIGVAVQDAGGNLVDTATSTVALAITTGTGTSGATLAPPAGTSVVAVNGTATFSGLSVDSAGTGYSLRASAAGLTPDTSTAFNIVPGPAVALAFQAQPAGDSVGSLLAPVQVVLRDALGNVATGSSAAVTLALDSNPGVSTLVGSPTRNAVGGVATFDDLILNRPGTGYTLAATSGSLPQVVSQPFDIVVGPAHRLVFTAQPVDVLQDAAGIAVQVEYRDTLGNLIPTVTDSVHIRVTGGSANLVGDTSVVAVGGVAAFSGLALGTPGTYTLTARSSRAGVAEGTSASFQVISLTAERLVFTVQPAASVRADSFLTVTVAVRDASNQPVPGQRLVALRLTPGTGTAGALLLAPTVTDTLTMTDAQGVAQFTVRVDSAGAVYTVTAADPSQALASGTSTPFQVLPGRADHLVFVGQPTSRSAGQLFAPAVQVAVHDTFGNLDTTATDPVIIAIAAPNPTGDTLNGTKSVVPVAGIATFGDLAITRAPGTYAFAASAAGLASATSLTFTVNPGPLSQLAMTPHAASITTVAGTAGFAATPQDQYGNTVAGQPVTYATLMPSVASVGASSGLVTAQASGQSVVAASAGGITAHGVVTVAVPGATPVSLWVRDTVAGVGSLEDVFAAAPDDILVGEASAAGQVWRFNGIGWTRTTIPGITNTQGLGGTSPSDVFAVGNGGYVTRFNGTGWQSFGSLTSANLKDAWAAAPNDVWAVGGAAGAVAFRFDGSQWAASTLPPVGAAALTAVWGAARDTVFAVGTTGGGGVAMRYDGATWSEMTLPGGTPRLEHVWGVNASDLFAVGAGGTILRFDGTAWAAMTSPVTTDLYGVWGTSPSDVYAVGLGGTMLRFDGSAWSVMAMPDTVSLLGVGGTAAGPVFATGYGGGAIYRGYRGGSISLSPVGATLLSLGDTVRLVPEARDGSGIPVTGLAATNYMWTTLNAAVATVGPSGLVTAVAEGTAAIVATAPGGAADTVTVRVAVPATVIVTPAGVPLTGVGTSSPLAAEVRDGLGQPIPGVGVTWTSPNPAVATVNGATGEVSAVSSGQVTIAATAAGATGYALVTVAIPGATPVTLWAPMVSGTGEWLTALWGTSNSDLFAGAGHLTGNGRILHFDGTSWSTMTTIAGNHPTALWGTAHNFVVAVTAGDAGASAVGTAERFDGSAWASMTVPDGRILWGVWGSSPTDVFAVGGYDNGPGRILHHDGTSWTEDAVSAVVSGIWGFSRSDVYAVGELGTVRHFDGATWSTIASGTVGNLAAVWGVSGSDLFTVGSDNAGVAGNVRRYNGSSWTDMPNPATGVALLDIWGSSASDVYAVGVGGTILRFDGSTWAAMASGTTSELNEVWGVPSGDVFVVGRGGTILRGYRGATAAVTPATSMITTIGATVDLLAEARDGGSSLISGIGWTWTSANPSVATVDTAGVVTAVAEGTADIIATAPGGAADTVTVRVAIPTSVVVTPAGASLSGAGAFQPLTAEVRDGQGQVIPGITIAWTSWNPSVASIDASGVATAVASGQAIVAATAAAATGYALLSVSIPVSSPVNLWVPEASPTSQQLNRIWGAAGNSLYAVGTAGTILRYDGISWSQVGAGATSEHLDGLWGASATDLWAVGENGTVLRSGDGIGWSPVTHGLGAVKLGSVWGTTPSNVFVAGINGTLWHFRNGVWTDSTRGVEPLTGIWGTSDTLVLVSGYGGTLLRFNGTSWSAMASGNQNFSGLWGAPGGAVYAAGSTDMQVWSGGWSSVLGSAGDWTDVTGTGSADVYAVGAPGTVGRLTGTGWVTDTASAQVMNAIAVGDNWAWAVGNGGTILRGYRGATFSLAPSNPSIPLPGDTLRLVATALDNLGGAITAMTADRFTWVSRSPAVATVTSTGLLTAITSGTSWIVVSAPGGLMDSVSVTVPVRPAPQFTWSQVTGLDTVPVAGWVEGQVAFDRRRGVMVLYGGADSASVWHSETFEFDGARWYRAVTDSSPGTRVNGAMTYDSRRNVVMLYGGIDGFGPSNIHDDLWEYDGINWVRRCMGCAPGPLKDHVLAYDSARGRAVLFGGHDGFAIRNVTWEYDGNTWTQVTSSRAPAGRQNAAMAWDSATARVVLYGGINTNVLSDWWTFDGTDWDSVAAPPLRSPGPRSGQVLVAGPVAGRLLFYGGRSDLSNAVGDAWTVEGLAFDSADASGAAPTPVRVVSMVYSPQARCAISYGGFTGAGTTSHDVHALGAAPCDLAATAATAIQVTGGNNQAGDAGQSVPNPLQVRIGNGAGQGLAGRRVTFRVTSAGGAKVAGADSVTVLADANGIASTTLTLRTGFGVEDTIVARLAGSPFTPVTFTAQVQTSWWNDTLTFAGGALLPGWGAAFQNGNSGFFNDRAEARVTDGGVEVGAVGPLPAGTTSFVVQYDANMTSSTWGMMHDVLVTTSAGTFRTPFVTDPSGGTPFHFRQYGDTAGTYLGLGGRMLPAIHVFENDDPLPVSIGFGDYRVLAEFTDGSVRMVLQRHSDGVVVADRTYPLPNFAVANVTGVYPYVHNTTDATAWMDNVRFRIGGLVLPARLVDIATDTIQVGPGTIRPLVVTVRDLDGNVTGAPVSYATADPRRAGVAASGEVTGIAADSTWVTATSGSASDTVRFYGTPSAFAGVCDPARAAFRDSFPGVSLDPAWQNLTGGPWTVGGGFLTGPSGSNTHELLLDTTLYQTGDFSAVATLSASRDYVAFLLRNNAANRYFVQYFRNMNRDGVAGSGVYVGRSSSNVALAYPRDDLLTATRTGALDTVGIRKTGDRIEGFINRYKVFELVDTAYAGITRVGLYGAAGPLVDDVAVCNVYRAASVAVNDQGGYLTAGDTLSMLATVLDSVSGVLTGRRVTWTTSDPAIATVNATGLVTGVAHGSATITATVEGVSQAVTVRVAGEIVIESDVSSIRTIRVVSSATGAVLRDLSPAGTHAAEPVFSRDGSLVAFAEGLGGSELIRIGADGTGRTPLTANTVGETTPAFSPDASQVVMSQELNPGGQDWRLFILTVSSGSTTRLNPGSSAREWNSHWSADGSRIVFDMIVGAEPDIFAVNPDGSGLVNLTIGSADADQQPKWSPSGSQIVFTSHRDGNHEIYVMNADGSGVLRLTNHASDDLTPAWSPDGRWIVWASDRSGTREMWKMRPDGSQVTQVTTLGTGLRDNPDWRPVP